MDQARFAQRARELREQCPAAFSHPELQAGEIWVGNWLLDAVGVQVAVYRENGMPRSRFDPTPTYGPIRGSKGTFPYHAVFIRLDEYIAAEEKYLSGRLPSDVPAGLAGTW